MCESGSPQAGEGKEEAAPQAGEETERLPSTQAPSDDRWWEMCACDRPAGTELTDETGRPGGEWPRFAQSRAGTRQRAYVARPFPSVFPESEEPAPEAASLGGN